MLARPWNLVSLSALLLATSAAPKPRRVEHWHVARDAQLELLAYPRGTPAPLELRVAKGERHDSLPRVAGPRPEPMRAEFAAARSWAVVVLSMYAPNDSTRFAGSVWAASLEGGMAGDSLTFVPLAGRAEMPDSTRVRFTSRGRTFHVTLPAVKAWDIAWSVGEAANVLDPEGRADYARAHRTAQVDRPAGPSSKGCRPRHPFHGQPHGGADINVTFVIDTAGRVEQHSFKVIREAGVDTDAYVQAIVRALPCMRYRPAELRGRNVRLLAEQPFEFR